jgi:hypothetical protein
MPLTVADLKTLEEYLDGVMNRSDHHAKTVGGIALALVGAVLWKKDPNPIEMRTHDGKAANILWFHVNGTLTGAVRHKFNNKSSVSDVYNAFGNL